MKLAARHYNRSHLALFLLGLLLLIPAPLGAPGRGEPAAQTATSRPSLRPTRSYLVLRGESLHEIALKFKVGYRQMIEANPGVDPFVPGAGTRLIIPLAFIPPESARGEGILINLSELRLYLLSDRGERRPPASFPVGIGSEGSDTPLGIFRVVEKMPNPVWHVPRSIRNERPELPELVPPGPENPLGSHALRLSQEGILIHGTNKPFGVGMRTSHGCIRLYPEQIAELYRRVRVGTAVEIVRQPVKMLRYGGRIYLEVHDDPGSGRDYFLETFRLIVQNGVSRRLKIDDVVQAIFQKRGYPVDVGG